MTLDDWRAQIAEARSRDMDPEARPWFAVTFVRHREPMGRTVQVVPGLRGELLSTAVLEGRRGIRVHARVFADDAERWLAGGAQVTRLTPESVREMLAPERANLAWPTDVASDIARAYLDAIAEVERLRAVIEAARADLLEHTADEDCAGPRGTARRGACSECRIAEALK